MKEAMTQEKGNVVHSLKNTHWALTLSWVLMAQPPPLSAGALGL